jgi:hypothetical protein
MGEGVLMIFNSNGDRQGCTLFVKIRKHHCRDFNLQETIVQIDRNFRKVFVCIDGLPLQGWS